MKNNRTSYVIKNLIIGVFGQIFSQVLSFTSRTVFLYYLGVTYLGVSGLFSNIFSILSIAELGIGSAIIFSLYKPLAENDYKKISALMNLYSKAYTIVGLIIFAAGLSLTPFLDYIVKERSLIKDFSLIYLLYLLNTVITYFFSYKRALFNADQKNYVNVLNENLFSLLMKISQILVLIIARNFILFILIQIAFTFMANYSIYIKADKLYSYLKLNKKLKLSKDELSMIKKSISALFLLKIGAVVVNSTDNLLISSFLGIKWVGVYSNYYLIISLIQAFISQVHNSITSSIGNLINKECKEKSLDVFNKLLFLNFLIYGFTCIGLFNLLNPFIKLWIGDKFLLSDAVVFLIVLNFFIMGMRRVLWVYNNALGLFYQFRYMPFIEVIINLIMSILLLKKFGIAGIFLGTIISTLATYFIAEPYILYTQYFKKNLMNYFKRYFTYSGILVFTAITSYTITSSINSNSWSGFVFKFLSTIISVLVFFIFFFYRTNDFKYFLNILIGILKRIKIRFLKSNKHYIHNKNRE